MNLRTKERVLELANDRRNGISAQKGPEYAGSADRYADDDRDVLANFKRQGDRWGTSPLLPTGVYFGKHIDSIETFVREATKDGVTLAQQRDLAYKGEGILSRLDDARNYLDLLECLLVDLGILNDPRPESYVQDRDSNSLEDLGPVKPNDVRAASGDELMQFAEDYNYMRQRVIELRDMRDTYYDLYVEARNSANRMAEQALDIEVIESDLRRALETEPQWIADNLDDPALD